MLGAGVGHQDGQWSHPGWNVLSILVAWFGGGMSGDFGSLGIRT